MPDENNFIPYFADRPDPVKVVIPKEFKMEVTDLMDMLKPGTRMESIGTFLVIEVPSYQEALVVISKFFSKFHPHLHYDGVNSIILK